MGAMKVIIQETESISIENRFYHIINDRKYLMFGGKVEIILVRFKSVLKEIARQT